MRVAVALEIADPRLCNLEVPATLFQQFHPGRELDSLVNRLRRSIQTRRPVEERARASGVISGDRHSLDRGTFLLPQIDAKRALRRERRTEHGLSGRQTSVSQVFRRTVRDHGHIMAVIKQANPELQPRLAGANDQKTSQCPALRSRPVRQL